VALTRRHPRGVLFEDVGTLAQQDAALLRAGPAPGVLEGGVSGQDRLADLGRERPRSCLTAGEHQEPEHMRLAARLVVAYFVGGGHGH